MEFRGLKYKTKNQYGGDRGLAAAVGEAISDLPREVGLARTRALMSHYDLGNPC